MQFIMQIPKLELNCQNNEWLKIFQSLGEKNSMYFVKIKEYSLYSVPKRKRWHQTQWPFLRFFVVFKYFIPTAGSYIQFNYMMD